MSTQKTTSAQINKAADTVEVRANQAEQHFKVNEADASYFANKERLLDPNLPVTERLKAGVSAATDVLSGAAYRVGEEFYKLQAEGIAGTSTAPTATVDTTSTGTVADRANQLEHHMKAKSADFSYEANKEMAKNPNLPVGDRLKAGVNAAGDAVTGVAHRAGEEFYKPTGATLGSISTTTQTQDKPGLSSSAFADELRSKAYEFEHHVQAKAADNKFEEHKEKAQDPNLPVGDRLKAGVNAATDAVSGAAHRAGEEFYKGK